MSMWVYGLVLIVLLQFYVGSQTEVLIEESSKIESLHAPTGGVVELPCDVKPVLADDTMSLVIWYKQGHDTPIYSFDIREGVTSHWSDPSTLGARATFRGDADPAVLVLTKLRPEDSGQYRCRVDFIKSPTKNTRLNLTILIPPEKLIILDHEGDEVQNGVVGPYDEGTQVNLTCVAVGGYPRARVSWWKSHELLANSEARATVSFTLRRRDHAVLLTCQAATDPSIPPVSEKLSIDVNLPLLWLRLLGGKRPLVAGQTTELACQAVGARPKPSISWWKASTRLRTAREKVSIDGNVTTSVLTFVPSLEDNGRVISCRATHSTLPHSTLEDGWKMEIQNAPQTIVSLGAGLSAGDVAERSDVYLDCTVKANPPHTHLHFTHNGMIVKPGPGTLVANQSLVLQRVSRNAAGNYVCVARNSIGEGYSNILKLDIKYSPSCKNSQAAVLWAARGEPVDIVCDVDANPKENISYDWWFNSSSKATLELSSIVSHAAHNNKLRSIVYVANSTSDYGWLQCSATNSVGRQHSPCMFQILPADKPSPLQSCNVTNVTYDSLNVSCTPGRDGGIRQTFLLQVTDTSTGVLLYNASSNIPEFHVPELTSSNSLSVSVAAYNERGASESIALIADLLKYPRKQQAESAQASVRVVLAVASGLVTLGALAAVLTAAYCCRHRHENAKDKSQQEETFNVPLTSNKGIESVDSLDKNPDIIPLANKTCDSSSNISSTTNYSSLRPLISQEGNYDIPPNCGRYHDHDIECSQYFQISPMEYRGRPTYQQIPNLGPSIQGIRPTANVVGLPNIGNEYRRQPDKVYEDWLKYKNAVPMNTSSFLPTDLPIPTELYPPPHLFSNPPLLNMPELDHRSHLERPLNGRNSSGSTPVRFQDSGVYFKKSVLDEAGTR